MLSNFLPLVDWGNGVLQAVIMFGSFIALTVVLIVFMMGGKKKKED
jgi:hypothetical protein